jgi:hypothetical protein
MIVLFVLQVTTVSVQQTPRQLENVRQDTTAQVEAQHQNSLVQLLVTIHWLAQLCKYYAKLEVTVTQTMQLPAHPVILVLIVPTSA